MDINPDEIKHHIKDHYSKSVKWRPGFKSSKNDKIISKCINYLKRKQFEKIIKNCNNLDNKIILDAGCGNGEYSLALAKKFPNSMIYAIDFSKSMCEFTKERAKESNLNNIIVKEGDVDNLEFKDNFFDTVICIDLLHHIPDKTINKAISELSRVIKNQGTLITDFKNKHNPILYYQHKKKNRITYYRTNRTIRFMKNVLKQSNLSTNKVFGAGGPSFIAPYVTIISKKK